MAHTEQMFFFQNVKAFFPQFFRQRRVLEVGSLYVNGSVRGLFEGCDYKGIDIGPGPCVDEVCMGQDFAGAAGSYDVVLSTEVFEHTEDWDKIFLNMLRLVKRDGLVVFSCAAPGRPQHGTRLFDAGAAPHVAADADYYRNLSARDFREAFALDHWFADHAFVEDTGCLYFVGLAQRAAAGVPAMKSFKEAYAQYLHQRLVLGLPHQYIVDQLAAAQRKAA